MSPPVASAGGEVAPSFSATIATSTAAKTASGAMSLLMPSSPSS
jgi:hypothetical protein